MAVFVNNNFSIIQNLPEEVAIAKIVYTNFELNRIGFKRGIK